MNSSLTLPLWTHVLVAIYKSPEKARYCEKINRQVHASRSHMHDLVKLLEEKGIVRIEKSSKINRLCLTDLGLQLAVSLLETQIGLKRCFE